MSLYAVGENLRNFPACCASSPTGAYRTFARRAAAERTDGSKQDRVRAYVLSHAPNPFRMADIRAALPGVSDQTIRVVLNGLRREALISPDGLGRSASWHRPQ